MRTGAPWFATPSIFMIMATIAVPAAYLMTLQLFMELPAITLTALTRR